MKKLSRQRIEWLLRFQIRCRKKAKKNKNKKKKTRVGREHLCVPSNLCLRSNYEETVLFFKRLRDSVANFKPRKGLTVDFRTIDTMSPDASLILAAELDRWRRIHNIRLSPHKLNKWKKEIKYIFGQLGLFDLLGVPSTIRDKYSEFDGKSKYIKFQSGNLSDGSLAEPLLCAVSEYLGSKMEEHLLYIGLSESMTNVVQHAYPRDVNYAYKTINDQWWLSGSYSASDNKLTIMFYDQGVGIPNTLPSWEMWDNILNFLHKFGFEANHHGYLIRGALDVGKSRTKESHRGKGLKQLLALIEHNKSGYLRILSGNGEFFTDETGSCVCAHHDNAVGGTFIEWNVKLLGDKNEQDN